MSKKILAVKVLIFLAVVAILVMLGIWLGSEVFNKTGGSAVSPYSVVYLSDGEIYFGKLSWFPKLRISNPWTIQRQVDAQGKTQISVVQVNKSIWSPVDELYLNEKQVMAWSRLRSDGDMAKLLDNPQAMQQQAAQAQGQNPQQGQQPSDGFKGPSVPPPASK
jgi:hypothetical protein